MQTQRLKNLLVERALVTARQVDDAITLTNHSGCTWIEHLILIGVLDEDELCTALSRIAWVPRCGPNALVVVPRAVLACVPADVAFDHRVVPIGIDADGDLHLAMIDPGNPTAVAVATFFANRPVIREAATATAIAWALHHHYGARSALWPRTPRPRTAQPLALAA